MGEIENLGVCVFNFVLKGAAKPNPTETENESVYFVEEKKSTYIDCFFGGGR